MASLAASSVSTKYAGRSPTLADLIQQYPILQGLCTYLTTTELLSLRDVSGIFRDVITNYQLPWKYIDMGFPSPCAKKARASALKVALTTTELLSLRNVSGISRGVITNYQLPWKYIDMGFPTPWSKKARASALTVALKVDAIRDQIEEVALDIDNIEDELFADLLVTCKSLRYLTFKSRWIDSILAKLKSVSSLKSSGNARNLRHIGLLDTSFAKFHGTRGYTAPTVLVRALQEVGIETDLEPCWRLYADSRITEPRWKLSSKEVKVCHKCSTEALICWRCLKERQCSQCKRFWCIKCSGNFLCSPGCGRDSLRRTHCNEPDCCESCYLIQKWEPGSYERNR